MKTTSHTHQTSKMKINNRQYYHQHAGWVSKIRCVRFDAAGFGDLGEIRLYRIGETIQQLVNDTPVGEVTLSEVACKINGWGISDPVTVTTAGGSQVVASKSEIENTQRQ